MAIFNTLIDSLIICEYLHRMIAFLYLSPVELVFYSFKAPFAAIAFLAVLANRLWNSANASSFVVFAAKAMCFSLIWILCKLVYGSHLKQRYEEAVHYRYKLLIADNVDTAMCIYAAALLLEMVWIECADQRGELWNFVVNGLLHQREIFLNSFIPEGEVNFASNMEAIQTMKAQLMMYKGDVVLEQQDLDGRIANLEQQLLKLELEAVPNDMEKILLLIDQLKIGKQDYGPERRDLENAVANYACLEQWLHFLELKAFETKPRILKKELKILTKQLKICKQDFDLNLKHPVKSEARIAYLEQQLITLESFKRGLLEPSVHGKINDQSCGDNCEVVQPPKEKVVDQCDQQMSAPEMNDAVACQSPD